MLHAEQTLNEQRADKAFQREHTLASRVGMVSVIELTRYDRVKVDVFIQQLNELCFFFFHCGEHICVGVEQRYLHILISHDFFSASLWSFVSLNSNYTINAEKNQ